jgi:hypothetical protein
MPLLQKNRVRGMRQDHISCVCEEQQLISSSLPASCCGQVIKIALWSYSGSYHPCYSAIDLVFVAFILVPGSSDSDSEHLPLTVKGEFIAPTSVHGVLHPPEAGVAPAVRCTKARGQQPECADAYNDHTPRHAADQ